MKYKAFSLAIVFILISCGSVKTISDRSEIVELSPKKIIKSHLKNNFDRSTFSADLKLNYSKSGRSQNMTVKLKIEKDKKIWLSGFVFGFPVAKAIITEDRVSYYSKINKTYFDGDFTKINNLIGAELDFTMLQNIFLGDAIFKISPKGYDSSIDQQTHLLTAKHKISLADILLWIHPINYKIEKQEVRTYNNNKFFSIEYKDYKNIEDTPIPSKIIVLAKSKKNKTNIEINYKSIRIDEKISTPYKIPSGYKRILK